MDSTKEKCIRMSNLSIQKWGPAGWTFLHAIAFTYPEKPTPMEREALYNFIVAFAAIIPCARCQHHFEEMIRADLSEGAHTDALSSKRSISELTVEWHNRVNQRLGKRIVPFHEVQSLYLRTCHRSLCVTPRRILLVSIVALVGLVPPLVLWRKRNTRTR